MLNPSKNSSSSTLSASSMSAFTKYQSRSTKSSNSSNNNNLFEYQSQESYHQHQQHYYHSYHNQQQYHYPQYRISPNNIDYNSGTTGGLVGTVGVPADHLPIITQSNAHIHSHSPHLSSISSATEPLIAAAVKVQAAFRGHYARKQMVLTLNSENRRLIEELKERDQIMNRVDNKVKIANNSVLHLEQEIQSLRKHIADISISYETRIASKDAEIEALKKRLRSSTSSPESATAGGISIDTANVTRKEVDDIKTQLSNLLSLRDSEVSTTTANSNKDAEIKDLKSQLAILEAKNAQRVGLNQSPHPTLLQQRSFSEADTQRISPGALVSTSSTFSSQEKSKSSSILNVTSLSSKSIWAPVSSVSTSSIQSIGYFNTTDVPSPVTVVESPSDVLDEKDSSIPAAHINQYRALWSPLDAPTESPTDFNSESSKTLSDNVTGVFPEDGGYREHSPTKMYGGAAGGESASNIVQLVDKIVKTNDQSASLVLQQKLRSSNQESRDVIFAIIMQHGLTLMKNRFGNFLMQRCIEFVSKEQVRQIGTIMKGNISNLACDRFACHVVQKAIDFVEPDLRAAIVIEMFLTLPNTITHKFACHVWQRVFETKWTGSESPAIFQRVYESLKNQWHLIANDENGSLVIQCIFENCGDATRISIMNEILCHSADISKGQWGNWVIQHILEHGSPTDKKFILKVVTQNLFAMSIDQYASKVVEKAMKISNPPELMQMVELVLDSSCRSNGRPFLLDMMNNQYANYVVQHILTLAEPSQKEICIRIIRPHLTTLRSSKYGQRVAAIVEKTRSSPILSQPIINHTHVQPYFATAGIHSQYYL